MILLSSLTLFVIIYGLIYYAANKNVYESRRLRDSGELKIDKWSEYTISDGLWDSWTFMVDGGTHGIAVEASERWLSFGISWNGILILCVLQALICDVYSEKMNQLKTGRGKVVETGHSLILNWSDKTVGIIKEMALANQSEGGGVIVLLTPYPKEEIEYALSEQIEKKEFHGTKVVVRTGNPMFTADLVRVSAADAKSVLICASSSNMCGSQGSEDTADNADGETLSIVLALKGQTPF